MNNVCHLTSAHSRYDVRIFEKECTSLANNGFNVSLVVNDDKLNEIKNNVNIVSTNYVPKNRIDRILFSTKKVFNLANLLDADIYHLHDPELLPLVRKLKKLGKIVIFDAHEDTSEQIMDKEWIPLKIRKIVSFCYSIYIGIVLKQVDSIITVTPQLVEKFSKINDTKLVTNYPILTKYDEINYLSNFINPQICFAGGISDQWKHKEIIMAIDNISNIKYSLAGDSRSQYFEDLKSLNGWDKVDFLGKISHGDVEAIQKKSIAGMAINYANQIKKTGTLGNTKLFEYMAAGIPVICTNYSLWKEIVEDNNCGIVVDPNSVTDIEKAVRYILENPQEAMSMGQNGRKAVENKYNWSIEEKTLLKLYNLFVCRG